MGGVDLGGAGPGEREAARAPTTSDRDPPAAKRGSSARTTVATTVTPTERARSSRCGPAEDAVRERGDREAVRLVVGVLRRASTASSGRGRAEAPAATTAHQRPPRRCEEERRSREEERARGRSGCARASASRRRSTGSGLDRRVEAEADDRGDGDGRERLDTGSRAPRPSAARATRARRSAGTIPRPIASAPAAQRPYSSIRSWKNVVDTYHDVDRCETYAPRDEHRADRQRRRPRPSRPLSTCAGTRTSGRRARSLRAPTGREREQDDELILRQHAEHAARRGEQEPTSRVGLAAQRAMRKRASVAAG